jgi:thioredoxin reductase/bacterioferritin-associated ferredoxin
MMHAEPSIAGPVDTEIEHADVVVIGAGPAGLAAATCTANAGMRTVLLDEQDAVGGQIYRAIERSDPLRRTILGPDYVAGAPLAAAFSRSSAQYLAGSAVWQVTQEHAIHYLRDGKSHTLQAKRIILATGAMERPFPIPGWTLPGAMTAGAAQILLKSAGEVPASPPILAGCGPLLYLLGWQYVNAGIPVRALVDTTRHEDKWRAKRHALSALRSWPYLKKGLQLLRTLRQAGTPLYEAADSLRVEGTRGIDGAERASALTFSIGKVRHRIEADVILLHQGVVPNTQITQALRAHHQWNDEQLCFVPTTDAWGELSVPGIFIAGDGMRIGGAQAAEIRGHLSGLAVAAQLDAISTTERDRQAAPARHRLAEVLRIRPFLDTLYRPREENRIPGDDVIVCRCEEVTAGQIRNFVKLGCLGPNQAKSFGRCGMGPCQGRLCGLSVTEVIAHSRGVPQEEVGYYRIRAPFKPVTLGELAGE